MILTVDELTKACEDYLSRHKVADEYEVRQAFLSGVNWLVTRQLTETLKGGDHGK